MKKELYVECECLDPAHRITFRQYPVIDDEDEPELYIGYYLNKYPFFIRVLIGIKYILGIDTLYHFHDTIITKDNVMKIKDFLTKIIAMMN